MSNMRGLAVFISDLRNARARELEEKRVNTELAKIRAKFRDSKLSGYDRKKYVCKLLYMYILGWNIDFGHLETVSLISSQKYSEKQIGYLGVTLFLNEHHELLHLVVNSIKKDLLHNNELFNCLALHCIANIGGKEMGTALAQDVHQLLVSGTSRSFVRKKAALTLLRLYRKSSGIIDVQWAPRLVSLLSDPDSGVALSVTSLLIDLATDRPELYSEAYQRAVHRLKSVVIDGHYVGDDRYYTVPCPWLQIKLMKFLMLYPSPTDRSLRDILSDVLEGLMQSSEGTSKNVQQNNAQNAILFQAIDLAMHVDIIYDFNDQIMTQLGNFLKSKETNIRYLGLETLSRLTTRPGLMDRLRRHQVIVSHSLKDRDVSVRRRALDLLYAMCHLGNAKETISELLRYLQTSDQTIKEELVLKIAVLVEKYATEYEWYLSITLQLLATAGDHVADEVWQRVVQIVANNESLQEHAARTILAYLRTPTCHETIIKLGGIILGEFGHLIANEPACAPIDQFSILHSKFNVSTAQTRAILLSTYIKFFNVFPEIASELTLVFRLLQNILDAELQQRACEYLALAEMPSDALLQAICEEMPPYPRAPSKLISKLYSKESERPSASVLKTNAATNHSQSTPVHLSPQWEIGYARLAWRDHGVLYEDGQLCIIVKSTYQEDGNQMTLTLDNKTSTDFSSFVVAIDVEGHQALSITSEDVALSLLPSRSQTRQTLKLECHALLEQSPILKVKYLAGALQETILKLPIILGKFLMPSNLEGAEFEDRWSQLHAGQLQAQKMIRLSEGASIVPKLLKILRGHRWGMLPQSTTNVFCGAAVLRLQGIKKIGCLIRLQAKRDWTELEITIRASVVHVASILQDNLAINLPTSL